MINKTELAPGLMISPIITGLWQIADMERNGRSLDPKETAKAMQPYFNAGLTTFDMADHYGSAELIAGEFRQSLANQNEVQLFTKWVPKAGAVTRDEVKTAVQLSLDRLQTNQIDLLQYHCWNYADPIWLDTLFWLQELKQEGLIRHLGLTNVDTAHLRMALTSGIEIVTNQVSYSLLDQRAGRGMRQLCEQFGIKILAFGTIAGGFLSEKWLNQPEPDWGNLETWSQMKYGRYIKTVGGWEPFQNLLQTIDSIAKKHQVSMANVACKAVLQQPFVGGVIIGARLGQNAHIENNLNLLSFDLDGNDWILLASAHEQLGAIPGDCGDEYRKPPFLTASGDLSHHLEQIPAPYPTQTREDGSIQVFTGTKWEALAGFCRAIQRGEEVHISGTTATHGDQLIGGDDPASQTHFIIDKIEGVLQSLNGRLEDVIRTRIYIRNLDQWEPIALAHGERFAHIQPANTLVQAALVGDEYLVEIEVDARVTQ